MAGSPDFPRLRSGGDASRTQDNVAGQLGPVAKAVAGTPMLSGTLPQWVTFSLAAGFSHTNSFSPTFAPGSYHIDALRYVHIQGSLLCAAGCIAGTLVLVVPQGFRSKYQQRIPVKGNGATYQSLALDQSGNLSVEVAIAAGGFVDLYGSWLADG